MKIIDRYLLKTYLITFGTVFVILFFVFILQTVWLFISELAGKDMDLVMIFQFLVYSMPRIIPFVLPLGTLLASIMTLGNFAESYEFAAMKSAGISLQRALRPLFGFIVFTSIIAFFFANNIIPYSEYKFINFRIGLAQTKPAMAILEGQFNDIGIYNIKVNKKYGENGRFLKDVTIHKKEMGTGNKIVIKAKTGELISSENSNTLQMVLNDGYYYEDIVPRNYNNREKLPFAKSAFKKYVINIDLTSLNNTDAGKSNYISCTMLSLRELNYTIDSLDTNLKKEVQFFSQNNAIKVDIPRTNSPYSKKFIKAKHKVTKTKKKGRFNSNILSHFKETDRIEILRNANSNIDSKIASIDYLYSELKSKDGSVTQHWLSVYDKFVIVFACYLMFFIGAPLGAIIRKGGFGLPIVFAVAIFISFHFMNLFARKVAEEGGISVFMGSWMSSLVLTPLAILFTYTAINDFGAINVEMLSSPFRKLFQKIFPTQEENNH